MLANPDAVQVRDDLALKVDFSAIGSVDEIEDVINTMAKLREGSIDVALARGIVTVRAEKSKSRKARDIFVGTRLTEFLRVAKDNGRYVFKGPKGDPIRSVKTAFNAASRRAGLQRLRFHDLRHTAASLMLQGTDPATVKAVLGHHSIEMTDRYLHTTESLQREAIGRLSDVILQSDGQNMVKVEGHHQEPIRLSDSN